MVTKRTTLKLFLAGIAGLTLFTTTYVCMRGHWPSHEGQSAHKTVDYIIRCEPSKVRIYTLDYRSQGKIFDKTIQKALSGPFSSDGSIDIKLSGTLKESCRLKANGKRYLSWEIIPDAFSMKPEPLQNQDFSSQSPTEIELAPTGQVASLTFPRTMSESFSHIIRDIASHRSLNWASKAATQNDWMSTEDDINGTYQASYKTSQLQNGLLTILKERTRYTKTASEDPSGRSPLQLKLNNGKTEYTIGADFQLSRLTSQVSLDYMEGSIPAIHSETDLSLKFLRDEAYTAAFSGWRSRVSPDSIRQSNLKASDVDERLLEKIQKEELGQETWSSLHEKIENFQENEAKGTKLFLQLKALFLLQPDTCSYAAEMLAEWSAGTPQFNAIAGALISTGTRQAQEALLRVINSPQINENTLITLVAVSGLVKKPEVFFEEGIWEKARQGNAMVSETAWLSLGNMARHNKVNGEYQRAERIVTTIKEESSEAKSSEERSHWLLVVGNASSASLIPLSKTGFTSSSTAERQAAAESLRFVEGTESDQLLINAAKTDVNEDVRASSLTSLSNRENLETYEDLFISKLTQDSSDTVRLAVLSIAAKGTSLQRLKKSLENVAMNDKSKAVREQAQSILDQQKASML